jgi:hypothetical protein
MIPGPLKRRLAIWSKGKECCRRQGRQGRQASQRLELVAVRGCPAGPQDCRISSGGVWQMVRDMSKVKYIVIHHTVTPENTSVNRLRTMHQMHGYSDIGYHYVYSPVYGFKAGRHVGLVGAHAASDKSDVPMNTYGIGFAIVGTYHINPPEDKDINEIAYNIKMLAKKFNIKLDRKHILPHYELDYTECPGVGTIHKIYKKLEI